LKDSSIDRSPVISLTQTSPASSETSPHAFPAGSWSDG